MNDDTRNDKTRSSPERFISDGTLGSRDLSGIRNATHGQFGPGDMIDSRYQVLGMLGRGGFGCVYKVNQILLRKEFALKTLNPVSMSETTILRLRKEAQAASRLQHPNLVQALDFGMIDGVQPYLVMELVDGPTLAEYLKEQGRLPLAMVFDIFIPLAQAVAYAHGQGVVHRDLKPSNIMLASGRSKGLQFIPKIVDFGIAKILIAGESQAMSLTGTGDIFGTPLYMSPEQCTGVGVDARSDIYSLGCMLFEALTGAPPFTGRNALEIMMQHGSAQVPSLREASLGGTFSPELERVVSSMLAKLPDERYSSSQKVADDLFWLQQGNVDKVSTVAQTGAVYVRRQARKQDILHITLGAAACIIFGAALGFLAAVSNRPTETKTITADIAIPAQSGFASKNDAAYLSSVAGDGGERVFKFPQDDSPNSKAIDEFKQFLKKPIAELEWGAFNWWNSKHLHSVDVPTNASKFSVPGKAKLIFMSGYKMVKWPYMWGRFKANELYGVILSKNTCSFDDAPVDQIVRSLSLQDDMRILSMNTITMSPKALQSLAGITSLRWLDLMCIWTGKGKKFQGHEIATFPFLQKLQVLRLEGGSDILPVLKILAKENSLRALSVADDNCSDEDLKLIGQLQLLEVLNVRGGHLTGNQLFSTLSNLPHLKKLVVDEAVLQSVNSENLKSLKGLTIMIAHDRRKPLSKELLDNLKGCIVIPDSQKKDFLSQKWNDEDWFDSLQNDPAQFGV